MAEELKIAVGSKQKKYETLVSQISALILGETNAMANLANTAAAIQMTFQHLWVGFYILENNELVLGPFQGPIACTRIKKGKGVCGTSWAENKTIIVDNVDDFPGHIACSSASVSEIVVPMYDSKNQFYGVLDIDSMHLAQFDLTDQKYLEEICQHLSQTLSA